MTTTDTQQQTFELTGMTCGSCETRVSDALRSLPEVRQATASRGQQSVTLEVTEPITAERARQAIAPLGDKYALSSVAVRAVPAHSTQPLDDTTTTDDRTWLATYKPILLIFGYILGATLLVQLTSPTFDYMEWMRHFMAGFFLTFSFFKLLNLQGFAESYRMYDVIARRIPAWGYVYAFTELGLGIAYLVGFAPILTNAITLVVMSVSIIGVLQTVLDRQRIQCACLGDVFDLPMSTVTVIEDGLMIAMAAVMLAALLL